MGQLLTWGDKLQARDSPKPSEEILLRWASHTLTRLAATNRSRTEAALRAVAESIEASPPVACLLPPQLLLRYGPSAIRQQLLAIPDAAAAHDLSNLADWMRAAAGVYDLAERAAGWQRILAGLAATSAAPAPPQTADGGVGAPEASSSTPLGSTPPGPREGCFKAKARAVRDPTARPLRLPALSEAAARADEVAGSPPPPPHTAPPTPPHQQQGHLRVASSPSAAQPLKTVAAPGLVTEVHASLHDGPAVAGGAEARHWRVSARVRCVSREARTVSRILVAEQACHAVHHVARHTARCRVPCSAVRRVAHPRCALAALAAPSLPSLRPLCPRCTLTARCTLAALSLHLRCTLAAPSLRPQVPDRDFELPPAEVREGLTPGTASGTAFGAATGAAATGAAADSYYATLGRLCTRDTTFAQPVKLAGARGFFGGGGGQLELVLSPPQVEKGTGARALLANLHLVKRACASLLATPVAALGPVSRPRPGGLHEPPSARQSSPARHLHPCPGPVYGPRRPSCAVVSAVRGRARVPPTCRKMACAEGGAAFETPTFVITALE